MDSSDSSDSSEWSVLLVHFPISVRQAPHGMIHIVQGLGDPNDPNASVSITVSQSQAAELAKLLAKLLAKATGKKGPRKPYTASKHFDEFWALYPANRRFNRAVMARKWASDGLDAEWGTIRSHLQHMIASPDWRKEGGKFIPLVSTYVNQRRWEAHTEQASLRVDV